MNFLELVCHSCPCKLHRPMSRAKMGSLTGTAKINYGGHCFGSTGELLFCEVFPCQCVMPRVFLWMRLSNPGLGGKNNLPEEKQSLLLL